MDIIVDSVVNEVRCGHHWIIDRADGRTSRGKCALCGLTREFPNYLSDCLRDAEKYEEWLARQGKKAKKKGNWDVLSDLEEGFY